MSVMFKGIELEGLDKKVGMIHSIAMAAMGQDRNENTEYLDKILSYMRADVSPARFDEINQLYSVVKMNYQVCNGGIYQYYGNHFDQPWKSDDGETELWDKEAQVKMLRELVAFADEVFPVNVVENSRLRRMVEFFASLSFEESVPQYEMIYSEEDEQIWDEEEQEWVDNPEYEEPYEDVVDYCDEIHTDLAGFNVDSFDSEYYAINEYLEKIIECYAQFIDKTIEKEADLGVDSIIQDAQGRAQEGSLAGESIVQTLE